MAYSEWKNLQEVERYARKRYRSWDQRWLNQREKKLVRKLFQKHNISGTILDVPVGYGRFQHLLGLFGTLLAADLGFLPLLYAKEHVGLARGSVNCGAENLPFSDNSVDVIFCFRLMQHLHKRGERIAVLREFGRVSRKWVIVSVYLSSFLHQLHRTIVRQPSRITMLSRAKFEGELEEVNLTLLEKVSVMPGLHAHRICLLAASDSA